MNMHEQLEDEGGPQSPRTAEAGGPQAGPDAAQSGDEIVREANDRALRAQAELENFRRRSRREFDDAQRYREIDLLRDLLPVLDNVLRALEARSGRPTSRACGPGFA